MPSTTDGSAEQVALRRIAALVARGVQPRDLFAAVAEEVGRVVDAPSVAVARYESDGTATVCATFPPDSPRFPVGTRVSLDGNAVPSLVRERAAPARLDDYTQLEGEIAEAARSSGMRCSVGVPVVVAGRVWGVIIASSTERLPESAAPRLSELTELLAAAIADTHGREALTQVAAQQAALRRVATLVARDVEPRELFAAVAEEVARVVGAPFVAVARYEKGSTVTVCGASPPQGPLFPTGSRVSLDGVSVLGRMLELGKPSRIDDYTHLEGEVARAARDSGVRSGVGVPIVVAGRVWGSIVAWSTERLPEDFEVRLAEFTELLAAAIANTEATRASALLADEQAALRRVATLVARESLPMEIFGAVTEEARLVLEIEAVGLLRFEVDGTATLVAQSATPFDPPPLGTRFALDGENLIVQVHRTGEAARVDDWAGSSGSITEAATGFGIRSAVASPVAVEGRLWGTIVAVTTQSEPLPAEMESRMAQFTGLVATAIANAESRSALGRLADEQAALRRVATLVAEGAPPDTLFRAVTDEVALVVGTPIVMLSHHHGDGSFTVVASRNSPGFPLHSRWQMDGPSLAAKIHETRRSARIDDYSSLGGSVAKAARDSSVHAAAGAPIVVDGNVWGHMSVATIEGEPLPVETEQRLHDFTELLATAISNAESSDALARLAEEQAALRRVATLVARGAGPAEVFNAVAMEVGKLLDTDITVVGRYDGDGSATATGSWSASPGGVPVGTRSAIGGRNVLTLVAETGEPARIDGYDDASGEAAEIAREHGWRSSIAAPISVEGRLWGVMLVATQRPERFPAGAEERLAAFTDLVATALANAQAHDEVLRFGEEQAALGRVATLVAAGAEPEQVFTAVVDEASSLLGLERIEFVRYEDNRRGTVIAASGQHPFPAGSTWSLDDPSVMATVARTRRAARIDDYETLPGEIARKARAAGFRSAIGAPVTVEGDLWGVVIAISTDPEPIPERSEARLSQFTGLIATAVANAEARQALERVAAEQATLRRIATLVAQGAQPEEVFAAVAEETTATFDAVTGVMRFVHDPPGVVVVGIAKGIDTPIGTRWDLMDGMASAEVYRTGRSARSDARAWSSSRAPGADAGRLGIVSQVASPITVEGRVWGTISVNAREELPPDTEQRLEKFTQLVATAIANAESKSELAASRRRIVAAADEARRRIERDLHDGIQQRLIALTFRARAMERKPAGELASLAGALAEDLTDVTDELREVARGIHPTILTEAGLGPALRALARRSDVPIEVDVRLDERLPTPVEAAAYYIASEALTNVAKHAQAKVAQLTAWNDDGVLTLEVRDDGIGGVHAGRGSGILGLVDRVEALGGTISIASPRHVGTSLSVRLPITSDPEVAP